MARKQKTIVCVGDPHMPFQSQACMDWILDIILPALGPVFATVCMGDLYDFFSYSRFPKRMSMTPKDETFQARDEAEKFFERIRKRKPWAKHFLLKGNHDDRLAKYVVNKVPELDHWFDYKSMWEFPKIHTMFDSKEPLVIDEINFIHGHSKVGEHSRQLDFPKGVVTGHNHIGQINWFRSGKKDKYCFEACAGYTANPFHESLIYRPMTKFFKWTQGVLVIQDGIPLFIPYLGGEHK